MLARRARSTIFPLVRFVGNFPSRGMHGHRHHSRVGLLRRRHPWSLPTRHGEPAVLHKPVKFISKPPGWAWALIVAGALPYLIAVMLLRKEVYAPSWPFCARCQQMHKKRTLIGAGLFLPLILLFAVAFAAPDAGGTAAAWFGFVAVIACVVGIGVLARGSYRLLPQGFVARDGKAVGFPKAHPAFMAEAGAAYQRAAQP